MRPFVEASWLVTLPAAFSSGRIALASCLPSSTPHWSNELMFQITPWVKILCSYRAISEPRVRGVSFLNRIELLGLLPAKHFCGTNLSSSAADSFEPFNSARTSSADVPLPSASLFGDHVVRRIGISAPHPF